MAQNQYQGMYMTTQPQPPNTLVIVDPFRQMHRQWSTGLCNCCDDMGQCKSKQKKTGQTLVIHIPL